MDDVRFGAYMRAERRRRRWRQSDVARAAGVSQQTVSVVERGHASQLTLAQLRRVAAVAEVAVLLAPRGKGPEPDRLLDARHLRLVQAAILALDGWKVITEYTFNHYGDRGAVDILAWNAATETLLLIEVKSELDDLQSLLRSLDVRARVVPGLVARERGWRVRAIGSILVLPDEKSARRMVSRHAAVFDAALPARTVEVRRWLRQPAKPIRGIWFVSDTSSRGVIRNPGSPGRVRLSKETAGHARPPVESAPSGPAGTPNAVRNAATTPTMRI